MRIDATTCVVGSSGTVPGNRQKMYRTITVELHSIPYWNRESRTYETKAVADFNLTPHDARLLARALVAEARVVEAAKQ